MMASTGSWIRNQFWILTFWSINGTCHHTHTHDPNVLLKTDCICYLCPSSSTRSSLHMLCYTLLLTGNHDFNWHSFQELSYSPGKETVMLPPLRLHVCWYICRSPSSGSALYSSASTIMVPVCSLQLAPLSTVSYLGPLACFPFAISGEIGISCSGVSKNSVRLRKEMVWGLQI